jgi:RNA 3'-terminal phosphate cyclase (ATP)
VTRESPGPGNIDLIEIESEHVTEVISAFGQRGVAAERVADDAVREAREYLVSQAVAGEHLADQLLLPMALAGGGSFTATKLSRHSKTNAEIISKFLPVRFEMKEVKDCWSVRVVPAN